MPSLHNALLPTNTRPPWWVYRSTFLITRSLRFSHNDMNSDIENIADATVRGNIQDALGLYGWNNGDMDLEPPQIDTTFHIMAPTSANPLVREEELVAQVRLPSHYWFSTSCRMPNNGPQAVYDPEASLLTETTPEGCNCAVCHWINATDLNGPEPLASQLSMDTTAWREVGRANHWLPPLRSDSYEIAY